MRHTMLKKPRRDLFRKLGSDNLDAFVELGTWRGGSAGLVMASMMASLSPDNCPHCWLFDTFTGMPEPSEHDITAKGRPANDLRYRGMPDNDYHTYTICHEYLYDQIQYPSDKIHMISGLFQDTVPSVIDEIGEIGILHVDCDFYESVKYSLEKFYDKVVLGGYVVLDDYGAWRGAAKAIDEFLDARGLDKGILRQVDNTGRWIKK